MLRYLMMKLRSGRDTRPPRGGPARLSVPASDVSPAVREADLNNGEEDPTKDHNDKVKDDNDDTTPPSSRLKRKRTINWYTKSRKRSQAAKRAHLARKDSTAIATRKPRTLHLPAELWMQVFDNLDHRAIRSCSIVSSHFRALTQRATYDRVLFRHVPPIAPPNSLPLRMELHPIVFEFCECKGMRDVVARGLPLQNHRGNRPMPIVMDMPTVAGYNAGKDEMLTRPAVTVLLVTNKDVVEDMVVKDEGITVHEMLRAVERVWRGNMPLAKGWHLDEVCMACVRVGERIDRRMSHFKGRQRLALEMLLLRD